MKHFVPALSMLGVGSGLALAIAFAFPAGILHSPVDLSPFPVAEHPPIEETMPQEQANLLFVGDMMLDRSVYALVQKADDFWYPFKHLSTFFPEYDLRIGNLEGPVTTFPSVAQTSRFTFTFDPEYVAPLAEYFDVLSLANNHTHNFGRDGLRQTREFLGDADILHFGDPYNTAGLLSTTTEVNGVRLGFVGYHELHGSGFEHVVEEVRAIDEDVDVLFVLPHWGIEYERERPSAAQINAAHALIDAGADVIVGAHPHVVQPIERYNDGVIFYSLGNFIFDQYFSEDTMEGLAVGLSVLVEESTTTLAFELRPIDIGRSSQPSLASIEETEEMRAFLSRTAIGVSDEERADIRRGHFTLVRGANNE